jgi:hypothetical protein
MVQAIQNGVAEGSEVYGEQAYAETPFADPTLREYEAPPQEAPLAESLLGNWEFTTPFLPGESTEAGESESTAPEVAAFSEVVTELKDSLFREALEQLADEALEAHAHQLAGEYGDRESRDLAAERLLTEHFEPLAAQAEALLDHFFERLQGYTAESLTDTEIDRISQEVLPTAAPTSPASEQFLGGLLRKAGKLVSGAVNLAKKGVEGAVKLAGKGLAAIGKFALGPLLKPLKALARFLLKHVIRFALNHIPPTLRPLAQKLADRLFQAIHETQEMEMEAQEQTEAEALPAASDAAQLEAEFDVQAAQLVFTPDEAEVEHLVSTYGEGEGYSAPLAALDDTRSELIKELSRLQPGESAQPIMEQFVPALLWPAVKTAISVIGRPKVVSFIANLLARLIKPLIGEEGAKLLAPAIADAGLTVFGFETGYVEPRALAAEALAATVEETVNAIGELPAHVLENETLLSEAVQEAFEQAAAAYFPNSVIKPGLRESVEPHGTWARMPAESKEKRYAKYSDTLPVEIHPRVASSVQSFGNATLADHLRDHHGVPEGHSFKGNVTLYQALPGTRGSTIARAEGFPTSQLHPLTPHAAGVLLGKNAAMGVRPTPRQHMATPQKLHVGQRLYRVHPPAGRRPHHAHRIHSEMLINLQRGEIRLWLYLSEPMCQRVVADLAKGNNAPAAFKRLKPLLLRTTEALRMAFAHRHLPPEILVVGETPNLKGHTPQWVRQAGHRFGSKIAAWAQTQLAQFLKNSAEEFKRACASHHDGVTLRITMTRVPGMDALRQLSEGKSSKAIAEPGWPKGSPGFQVIARSGYVINRLRD